MMVSPLADLNQHRQWPFRVVVRPLSPLFTASDRSPAVMSSYFGLLCYLEGIVVFNAEVAHSSFQLGMSEQQLYRPKVSERSRQVRHTEAIQHVEHCQATRS
jgi:hypothetical protein